MRWLSTLVVDASVTDFDNGLVDADFSSLLERPGSNLVEQVTVGCVHVVVILFFGVGLDLFESTLPNFR
jgi:hypothetical protein